MRAVRAVARFVARPVRYRYAAWIIIGVTVFVSAVAVPIKVTVDGILYLSSAKSLFGHAMAANYAWFREPGYPVFLRVVHFFGNDGIYIVIAQALCLGVATLIALYAVRRMLGLGAPSAGVLAVVVLLQLNPMYLIYSALVLQQALFALQLALFGLGVVWALHRPSWLPRWLLVVLVLANYVAAIWTSIGWIYLALFPVVASILIVLWPPTVSTFRRAATRARKALVVLLALVAAVAVTGIVYQGGVKVYSGWEALKAPYLAHLTIPGSVIEPLTGAPNIPTPFVLGQRMFALMHMGVVDQYISENDLFLRQQMAPDLAKGAYDTSYVNKPYSTYPKGWITIPNPSNQVHDAYVELTAGGTVGWYVGTFIAFMLSFVLALVRRRWALVVVLLVPLSFIGVYALSNSPIDRYGVPAYPWAIAGAAVLVTWAAELVSRVRSRRGLTNPPKPS